jgi:hypothetical protein
MVLKKGSSKKVISENIKELIDEKPDKRRSKAIETISKKQHISPKKAKQKQAIAIALSEAGKSRKK